LSFIGGSLSSAGPMEGMEYNLPKDAALRPLFLADRPGAASRHGRSTCC
jgi:hypothetical protein